MDGTRGEEVEERYKGEGGVLHTFDRVGGSGTSWWVSSILFVRTCNMVSVK